MPVYPDAIRAEVPSQQTTKGAPSVLRAPAPFESVGRLIDAIQGFHDAAHIDVDRAGLVVAVEVSHGEAFQIAVEGDADEFAALVDGGAAVVAATDIGGAHEIELRHRIEDFAGVDPALGHEIRAFIILTVVEAAESSGVGLGDGGAIGVAVDSGELDAGSAGAIGVIGGAEELEAELGDLFGGGDFERADDVVMLFAQA